MPLETHDDVGIGTLCILDTVPRLLDQRARDTIKVLANEVMTQLRLFVSVEELSRLNGELVAQKAELAATLRSRKKAEGVAHLEKQRAQQAEEFVAVRVVRRRTLLHKLSPYTWFSRARSDNWFTMIELKCKSTHIVYGHRL